MPKRTLRQQLLARRRALAATERESASADIQRTLVAFPAFAAARVVALYAAIENEVETEEIFRAALSLGKEVLFPAVNGDILVFHRVTARNELHAGAYGIPEPTPACPVRDPRAADLLVIPAVGFDLSGQRLGYGKGYYDKTLHSLEGSGRLVGIAYDFQLVDAIAGEPHDVRMDVIITDKRVHYPRDLTYKEEVLRQ